MSNLPTIEPLTPDQRAQMAAELADFRLRAEHGLLKRLALEVEHGQLYRETYEALGTLTAGRALDFENGVGALIARLFEPHRRHA